MASGTLVLLNRKAGALRGSDFAVEVEERLAEGSGDIEVAAADGPELVQRLKERLVHRRPAKVIVGGGDGTVSAVAAVLCDTEVALGILPLGTLNLFARSLAMPLDLDASLAALANASERKVDLGEANGRVFTHHLSIGLQPQVVAVRENMEYRSRIGKLLATLRALATVLQRPPRMRIRAEIDGAPIDVVTPALIVSNNVYGADHLPYADALDEGVLGIYTCLPRSRAELAQLTFDAMLGRWRENGQVAMTQAMSVVIERRGAPRRPIAATVDGELTSFTNPISVYIRPLALTVLMPTATE